VFTADLLSVLLKHFLFAAPNAKDQYSVYIKYESGNKNKVTISELAAHIANVLQASHQSVWTVLKEVPALMEVMPSLSIRWKASDTGEEREVGYPLLSTYPEVLAAMEVQKGWRWSPHMEELCKSVPSETTCAK
jgi:hypothetical protein